LAHPPRRRDTLLLLLLSAIWGSSFLFIKLGRSLLRCHGRNDIFGKPEFPRLDGVDVKLELRPDMTRRHQDREFP